MPDLLRIFIDANILFSASWQSEHDFLEFWETPGAVCLTSFYAADEARRNCADSAQRLRLEALLEKTHTVSDATSFKPDAASALPAKDQPILAAAMQAGADFLVTGDKRHFAPLMNKPIPTRTATLTVLRPRQMLDRLRASR